MTRGTRCNRYYGMGTYMGDAVAQNAKGHVLGHVKDIGGDPSDPATRIYTTSAAQPYHVDSCDVVGLLCLQQAKAGGHSSFASSSTVYNEILQSHPRLAATLVQDFFQDRKGEVPSGQDPWFTVRPPSPHRDNPSPTLHPDSPSIRDC